jgi:hypothetical protein
MPQARIDEGSFDNTGVLPTAALKNYAADSHDYAHLSRQKLCFTQ